MKALIIEFFYDKKSILISMILVLCIYILYIPVFSHSEVIVSMFASFIFANLYGQLVTKRKNTNFEIFLCISPLGRKTIIKTGYLMGLISSIAMPIIFFILYFIRRFLIGFEPVINFDTINDMAIFASFGFGLIANAISFPICILPDRENNKFLMTIIQLVILGICGASLSIFSLYFLNFYVILLIYLTMAIVIYIISYLITLNVYLKKNL